MLLSFLVSGLVLAVGIGTAFVQSDNFAKAAALDNMQLESQWYMRRTSLLRAQLERNAFDELTEFELYAASLEGSE